MSDYIRWIRDKVGHAPILLNFAGGWAENDGGKVLLQKRSATGDVWGFPGGALELGNQQKKPPYEKSGKRQAWPSRRMRSLGLTPNT